MYDYNTMLAKAVAHLPEETYLVYVDYRDELSNDQVELLLSGGNIYEGDEFYDWWGESSFEGASYYIDEALRDLRDDFRDDEEALSWIDYYEEVLEDDLRDEVRGRDQSDPVRDLAANTPAVNLMVPLIDEDNGEWHDERKASQLLAALGTTDERHYNTARELIAEAPTDMGMAYVAFEASVLDIYEGKLNKGVITITDPVVIYGNPFTGGVWDRQFEGLTFRADASTIMRDGAWGYSLETIYGGYWFEDHDYTVGEGPLPAPIDQEELSYLDTIYDWTLKAIA